LGGAVWRSRASICGGWRGVSATTDVAAGDGVTVGVGVAVGVPVGSGVPVEVTVTVGVGLPIAASTVEATCIDNGLKTNVPTKQAMQTSTITTIPAAINIFP